MISPFHSLSQIPVTSPERLRWGPCWLRPVSFLISRPLCPNSSERPRVLSHFSRVWLLAPCGLHPPGSSVHGILQAGVLEWVAIPFSRGSLWPRDGTPASCSSCTAGGFFTAEPPGKPPDPFYGRFFASSVERGVDPHLTATRKILGGRQENVRPGT